MQTVPTNCVARGGEGREGGGGGVPLSRNPTKEQTSNEFCT